MGQSQPALLVVSWNFPPKQGGMEDLLSNLCKYLQRNHLLFAIAPHATSREPQRGWLFRAPKPGLLVFTIYALYQGYLLLRRFREIQVVLAGSAMVAPLVLILAKLCRRKAVVLVHGLDLVYPSSVYQALCVRWVRHCDRIIANSHHTASLARQKNIPKNHLHVIPPGVDWSLLASSKFLDAKAELGLDDHKVILFVGRLARRKGVKEFIEKCLPDIVAEIPEVVFLIVGGNPSDSLVHRDDVEGELKALLRSLKLDNHVQLAGWLSSADLARAYQAADLLVLPVLPSEQDVEGFGIVILEAAAFGKPCVATRTGGISDAIEDGKSGLLVEPGRYDILSQTVGRLLRDNEARSAMGKYAGGRVAKDFTWDSVGQQYEELFRALLTVRNQT